MNEKAIWDYVMGNFISHTHVCTQDSIVWAKLKYQNKNSPAF